MLLCGVLGGGFGIVMLLLLFGRFCLVLLMCYYCRVSLFDMFFVVVYRYSSLRCVLSLCDHVGR